MGQTKKRSLKLRILFAAGRFLLKNVLMCGWLAHWKDVFVRFMFVIHCLLCVWRVTVTTQNDLYWLLGALVIVIIMEDCITEIIEQAWQDSGINFCFVFYLACVVPSVWIIELARHDRLFTANNVTEPPLIAQTAFAEGPGVTPYDSSSYENQRRKRSLLLDKFSVMLSLSSNLPSQNVNVLNHVTSDFQKTTKLFNNELETSSVFPEKKISSYSKTYLSIGGSVIQIVKRNAPNQVVSAEQTTPSSFSTEQGRETAPPTETHTDALLYLTKHVHALPTYLQLNRSESVNRKISSRVPDSEHARYITKTTVPTNKHRNNKAINKNTKDSFSFLTSVPSVSSADKSSELLTVSSNTKTTTLPTTTVISETSPKEVVTTNTSMAKQTSSPSYTPRTVTSEATTIAASTPTFAATTLSTVSRKLSTFHSLTAVGATASTTSPKETTITKRITTMAPPSAQLSSSPQPRTKGEVLTAPSFSAITTRAETTTRTTLSAQLPSSHQQPFIPEMLSNLPSPTTTETQQPMFELTGTNVTTRSLSIQNVTRKRSPRSVASVKTTESRPTMPAIPSTELTSFHSGSLNVTETVIEEVLIIDNVDEDPVDDDEQWILGLQTTMILILIVARWLLPRKSMTRLRLSEILLDLLINAMDIMEFFTLFNIEEVTYNSFLTLFILGTWSCSLLQFVIVFGSRSKLETINMKSTLWDRIVAAVTDTAEILCALLFHEKPFFLLRFFVLVSYHQYTPSLLFFLGKNLLMVMIYIYRLLVKFHPGMKNTALKEESEPEPGPSEHDSIYDMELTTQSDSRKSTKKRKSKRGSTKRRSDGQSDIPDETGTKKRKTDIEETMFGEYDDFYDADNELVDGRLHSEQRRKKRRSSETKHKVYAEVVHSGSNKYVVSKNTAKQPEHDVKDGGTQDDGAQKMRYHPQVYTKETKSFFLYRLICGGNRSNVNLGRKLVIHV